MSRPQDLHRHFFSLGNPFRTSTTKKSYLSPRLLEMLNVFEVTLAERFRNLKPTDKGEVLNLSWMKRAVESLSATYTDIEGLITALELPVCNWDEKWIDVYLDNSIKLLDICIAFSSEISRLGQCDLYLQSFLHNLDGSSTKQFVRAEHSLDGWKQHIGSKNPRMENCFIMLDSLIGTLNLPKIKNSAKGQVLMRAMYGLKVATVFVCNVFATAFPGSSKKLLDLQLSETCLWSEAFTDLQAFVNLEIRNINSSGTATVLKELDAVDKGVKELYPFVKEGGGNIESEAFKNSIANFRTNVMKFSQGLDVLAMVEEGFFQIVLSGRDALLGNLRVGHTNVSSPKKTNQAGLVKC